MRRKGEQRVAILGNADLFKLLGCNDIDVLLAEETGLPVVIAEDPLTCVARGGGKALELMDKSGNADLLSTE